MPIDTSMYANSQPVQMPNIADAVKSGMSLSQMAMQQQMMQRQMAVQQMQRQAYAQNLDANGNLNQKAYLSQLGQIDPNARFAMQKQIGEADEATAKAGGAQSDTYGKRASVFSGAMHTLEKLPEDQRAQVWPQVVAGLKGQGVIDSSQKIPEQYGHDWFYSTLAKATTHLGDISTPALENQKTIAQTRKDLAEAAKAESETYKRNPTVLGQSNDPAVLVPNLVPKEHQAQAFKEIDAAENTRKMSKAILDSFDQAVADTRGAGRVTSLLKTPRSVGALHQSMQPTFKDLEGTVRQAAMDNTFKNITPNAADTDNDIATKRQALADYLQSKLAAPTARAYGIDLAKFQSTAPYESKPTRPGGSAGMIPTAYADDGGKQAAPAPQHRAGDVILYKGNHYRVGADGDTLEPVGGR